MTATVFFYTSGHGFGHAVRDAARFYAMFDERADREAAALQETRVDLVVGDIPPLAFEAAGRAGIPSIALGNFTWDWIYAAYDAFARAAPQVIPLSARAYAGAASAAARRLRADGGGDD